MLLEGTKKQHAQFDRALECQQNNSSFNLPQKADELLF